jgi:hypothetical protein
MTQNIAVQIKKPFSKEFFAMNSWRFFGRNSGGDEIYEIYRIPANGKPFHKQHPSEVERLKRDGSWKFDPTDKAIWAEMLKGDFSETADEISEEKVGQLFSIWSKGNWPGRS